ncbi:hypothetical protein [Actinomyces ruminicola]|uniref:Lipoprotein LpqN n=1 Tax=Actinomyces ruminicola TaxID=332524 RepID=A0A1G9YMG2_9ACTO|nr:hypothetical protein [Actinomyces ruminicola]SDN10399.1 hypothetical protein SAMN04487766_11370 [Actinomyces ruminicola]
MAYSPRPIAIGTPRRRVLGLIAGSAAVAAAGVLAACSPNEQSEDAAGAEGRTTRDNDAGSADAPDVKAAPLAVTGQAVQPVTGIQLTLPGDVQALTPERVGEGRTQVTYVWAGGDDWGYLVIEGPNSFAADDQSAAMIAANAERQRLIAALITPSEPRKLEWEGFAQCVQLTWSQRTVPPGWSQEASVDALALFCVAEGGRAYTVVTYGPRNTLEKTYAYAALCSATVMDSAESSQG